MLQNDSYVLQRGHEQIIHDLYRPILNKVNPVARAKQANYVQLYHQLTEGRP
jgi:hypothetical protein